MKPTYYGRPDLHTAIDARLRHRVDRPSTRSATVVYSISQACAARAFPAPCVAVCEPLAQRRSQSARPLARPDEKAKPVRVAQNVANVLYGHKVRTR